MSFTMTEIGPCKKRAEFILTTDEVKKGFDEVYEEITETVSIPGFRKGKVPRALLARKYGKDINSEVKEKLVRKTFYEMVDDNKIDLISQPSFDEKDSEIKEDSEFSYSVSFEIKPTVELPSYKKVALIKKVQKVSEEHLLETQNNILKSHAKYEEVDDQAIESDDYVTMTLEARDESDEVVHHNNNFGCFPSRGQVDIFQVEDLEKKIVGKKKSDKIEFSLDCPSDFSAKKELAGKKIKIKVEVEGVRRQVVPEFNEEFMKNLGFDSEEKYKETLTDMLEKQFEARSKTELKEQIYAYLDENVKTDLPEDTVLRHSEYLVNTKMMELMQSGMSQDEATAQKDELKKSADVEARRDIKVGFALSKISTEEKVFATEREVQQRIVMLAQQQNLAPEKMKEQLEENHEFSALRSQIKEEKTIELIIKKAEITEEEVTEEGKGAKGKKVKAPAKKAKATKASKPASEKKTKAKKEEKD